MGARPRRRRAAPAAARIGAGALALAEALRTLAPPGWPAPTSSCSAARRALFVGARRPLARPACAIPRSGASHGARRSRRGTRGDRGSAAGRRALRRRRPRADRGDAAPRRRRLPRGAVGTAPCDLRETPWARWRPPTASAASYGHARAPVAITRFALPRLAARASTGWAARPVLGRRAVPDELRPERVSARPEMPEGDALHRAAERLRVLEGEVVAVETPHPRAAVLRLAERLDGRRLERVEAVGKNLLLDFEGGLTLRSHLRMRGRWRVEAAGAEPRGTPWLVLRGRERQAVLWNGPGARADPRSVARRGAARPRRHGRPARSRRHARALPRGPSVARGRRGPARPAARRGHREHVEGGGALRRRDLARGAGCRSSTTRSCAVCSARPRA